MRKGKKLAQFARRFAYRAGDGERFVATVSDTVDPLPNFLAILDDAGGDLLHSTAVYDPSRPPRLSPIEREILVEKATDPRCADYDPEFHAWAVANQLAGARRVALA